jgi:hypothetical protein
MVLPGCPTCRALSAKAYEAFTNDLRLQDRADIARMNGAEPPSAVEMRLSWWSREVAMEEYRAHSVTHELDNAARMPQDVIGAVACGAN